MRLIPKGVKLSTKPIRGTIIMLNVTASKTRGANARSDRLGNTAATNEYPGTKKMNASTHTGLIILVRTTGKKIESSATSEISNIALKSAGKRNVVSFGFAAG
jgi:hypothetical protein